MTRTHRSTLLVVVALPLLVMACGSSVVDGTEQPPLDEVPDSGTSTVPSTKEPVCGNSACEVTETCSNCPGDCGTCSLACTAADGTRLCGGNGNTADPNILYTCQGGVLKVEEECDAPCKQGTPDQCPPGPAVCGDKECTAGEETCTTCPGDCGACLTCDSEGGLYCGGNTVGGDPNILYVCKGGRLEVKTNCGKACQTMPPGVPDRCPPPPASVEVPASLIRALSQRPYTEKNCTPVKNARWSRGNAMSCKYTASGVSARVTTANSSPTRVGRWIVDAATLIPALQALKGAHQAQYERGLRGMARFIQEQSGRIFPIEGVVVEVGICSNGGRCVFDRGVSRPCASGCYCRINSLHRTAWCKYQEGIRKQTYAGCLRKYGSSGYTEAWGNECVSNHARAWNSDTNEHFRAAAWAHNRTIAAKCPPGACTPNQVADLVVSRYVNTNPTF